MNKFVTRLAALDYSCASHASRPRNTWWERFLSSKILNPAFEKSDAPYGADLVLCELSLAPTKDHR